MRRPGLWACLACFSVLSTFSASSAATAAGKSTGGASVCLWSPLQQWLPLDPGPKCLASDPHMESTLDPSSRRQTAPVGNQTTAPDTWVGPHLCVGEYCVWANQGFGGGGIVLITTDDNAKKVARLTPSGGSSAGGASDAFKAQVVPGKGIGLVAKRPIRRGELIMAESPALLVHKQVLEDRQGLYIRSLELAVPKLPAKRRRAFMKQGMQGSGEGGYKIADILFANSFQMAVSGEGVANAGGFHYGNFPNVSRLNHDCRPNLVFHIDGNLTHTTHAVRDIVAGEELSISYGDQLAPVAERQARMRSSWGFSCSCAHCTLDAAGAAASADRLKAIAEAERELGDISSSKASIKMVESLLGMYEEERLESKISGAYTLAALNYNLFGKDKLARKYALLAAETTEWEFGTGTGDGQTMRDLAQNPKGHWSWRQRLRR